MEIQERIKKHQDAIILYSDYFEEKNGEVIKPTSNLKIKSLMLKQSHYSLKLSGGEIAFLLWKSDLLPCCNL